MGRQPSSLVVLGDHLVDDRGQARHLIECEADADPSEIVCRIPVVEAPAGDGTHLVVELGPADTTAAIAEADEVDRLRITRLASGWQSTRTGVPGIHRWLTLLFDDMTVPGALTGVMNRPTGSPLGLRPPRLAPPGKRTAIGGWQW